MQAVEEERAHGQLGTRLFDIQLAAEATHGDLEGMRPFRRIECYCLAVQYQHSRWQRAHHPDAFRNSAGDFVQAPGVDADIRINLVDLYPCAIHLPLEGNITLQRTQ